MPHADFDSSGLGPSLKLRRPSASTHPIALAQGLKVRELPEINVGEGETLLSLSNAPRTRSPEGVFS